MWKKILSLTFFGSFIVASSSNVVSCNILKQHQLSFNLKDWKESWAFNTQSIWQALGQQSTDALLEESKGLFLYLGTDNKVKSIKVPQLFNLFDHEHIKKSDENFLQSYLQLKYFVPSIIYYNEKPYNSPLKNYEAIQKNFIFSYSSKTDTKINEKLDEKYNIPLDQTGPVVELIWRTNQAGETLSAYFDLKIKLNNYKSETVDDKIRFISPDGYYIETNKDGEPEITWSIGIYFYLPL